MRAALVVFLGGRLVAVIAVRGWLGIATGREEEREKQTNQAAGRRN
jgi:hypothetical protein